jgi:hypothetical protein
MLSEELKDKSVEVIVRFRLNNYQEAMSMAAMENVQPGDEQYDYILKLAQTFDGHAFGGYMAALAVATGEEITQQEYNEIWGRVGKEFERLAKEMEDRLLGRSTSKPHLRLV